MESSKKFEHIQEIKDDFERWAKKFHDNLYRKNQAMKSCFIAKQERNKDSKVKIDKLKDSFMDTSTLAIGVIPSKTQCQLLANVNNLKVKSEQLKKCNETINAKVEEETKKMRKNFYEMITKDDMALKPYHEIEDAVKELVNKSDNLKRIQSEEKEKFLKNCSERELYYSEIKEYINILEPIEEEMRFRIQNSTKVFEEKLKSLKLNCIEEANDESKESRKLREDINNLRSQLNTL